MAATRELPSLLRRIARDAPMIRGDVDERIAAVLPVSLALRWRARGVWGGREKVQVPERREKCVRRMRDARRLGPKQRLALVAGIVL